MKFNHLQVQKPAAFHRISSRRCEAQKTITENGELAIDKPQILTLSWGNVLASFHHETFWESHKDRTMCKSDVDALLLWVTAAEDYCACCYCLGICS